MRIRVPAETAFWKFQGLTTRAANALQPASRQSLRGETAP